MKLEDVRQGQFVKFEGEPYVVVLIVDNKYIALSKVTGGLVVPPDMIEEYFFDHETRITKK